MTQPATAAELDALFRGFAAHTAIPMAWLSHGAKMRIHRSNAAFQRVFRAGETGSEPSLASILQPGTAPAITRLAEAALQSGTVQRLRILTPAALPRPCDLEMHPAAGPDGEAGLVLVVQEATACAEAHAALARSAEQMRLAIGAARMFFWDWDIRSGEVAWSEGLEDACALPSGSFGGSLAAFRALIHPDDLAGVERALGRALAGEAQYDTEFRMLRGDGGLRWVVARGTVLRDDAGRPVRMIGIDLDVTARRAEEEALRASEARLRLAEETAHLGLWDWDVRSDVQTWSPQQYALHGLDPSRPPPGFAAWLEMVHADDRPRLRLAAEQGFRSAHGRYAMTFRLRRADDGELRWLLALVRVLETDAEGRPLRFSGVSIDVTEHVELRTELRRTEALLKAIGDCTTDALYAKDEESRMLFANRATLAIVGKPLDELLGRSEREWHADATQARAIMANDRRIQETGLPEVVEETFDAAGMGTRIFRSAKAPLRDGEGRIIGVVGVSSDITALKQAEERLRETIAAYEMLVKEADHRIKNSLQLVAGLLRLQANRTATEEVQAALRSATGRVLAVAQTHRSLYLSPDLRTIDLCQVLRDLAAQAQGVAGERITVQCEVPDTLPMDAERAIPLGLVVNELLTNALKHAYPPGRDPGSVRLQARLAGGALVTTVADDGVGMAPGAQGGLGSMVVEAMARQIGARVSTDGAPGRGTSTTVSLDMARGTASAAPASRDAAPDRSALPAC